MLLCFNGLPARLENAGRFRPNAAFRQSSVCHSRMKPIRYSPCGWWVLLVGILLVAAGQQTVEKYLAEAVPLRPVLANLSGVYGWVVPEAMPGFIDGSALARHLFRDVAALLAQPGSALRLGGLLFVLLLRKLAGFVRRPGGSLRSSSSIRRFRRTTNQLNQVGPRSGPANPYFWDYKSLRHGNAAPSRLHHPTRHCRQLD